MIYVPNEEGFLIELTLFLYMILMEKMIVKFTMSQTVGTFSWWDGFVRLREMGCTVSPEVISFEKRHYDVTLTRTRSGQQTPASHCWREKLHRAVDRYNTEQRARARLLPWRYFLQQSLGWLFEPPFFPHMLIK